MQKLLYTLLLATALFSCSKEKNSEPASPFKGHWTGTYTGGDNGTWDININDGGIISGTGHSTPANYTFDLNGSVSNDGDFTATVGTASSGAKFSGTLVGSNGSGTWINGSNSGTWTGEED